VVFNTSILQLLPLVAVCLVCHYCIKVTRPLISRGAMRHLCELGLFTPLTSLASVSWPIVHYAPVPVRPKPQLLHVPGPVPATALKPASPEVLLLAVRIVPTLQPAPPVGQERAGSLLFRVPLLTSCTESTHGVTRAMTPPMVVALWHWPSALWPAAGGRVMALVHGWARVRRPPARLWL
jgi:hypothetical protein